MGDDSKSIGKRRERDEDDDDPRRASTPNHQQPFGPDRDINAEIEEEERVAEQQRRIREWERAHPRRRQTQVQQRLPAEIGAGTSDTAAIDGLFPQPSSGGSDPPPAASTSRSAPSNQQQPDGILKKPGQGGMDDNAPQKKSKKSVSFGVVTVKEIPVRDTSSDEEDEQEDEQKALGNDQSSDEDEDEDIGLSQDLRDLIAANLDSVQTQQAQVAGLAARYNAQVTSSQFAQGSGYVRFSASDGRIVEGIIGAIASISRQIAYLQRKVEEERSSRS